jgi:hypothetical protein
MDIVTLAAVSVLVVERILVHTITSIKRCKSRCGCSSDLSKDHDNKEDSETVSTPRMEIPKNLSPAKFQILLMTYLTAE